MPQLLDVSVRSEAEETELHSRVARAAASHEQTRFMSTKRNKTTFWQNGVKMTTVTLEFVFIEHTEAFWPDTEKVSMLLLQHQHNINTL